MTDESPKLVDDWVEERKPSYPVVSMKTSELELFLGVEFFPTVAVIAPDGTLAYAGSSREYAEVLHQAMEKAEKGPLWPKSLDKVAKWMEKGDVEKSYATLLKLVEGGKIPESDAAHLELFRGYLEGLAADALAKGKEHQEEGYVYWAVQAIEPYTESKPPFPATEDCRKLLAELEALPNFKDEMKGGEKFDEAWDLIRAREYTDGIDDLIAIAKKYEGTLIGERAHNTAKQYVEKGKYGYEPACQNCYDAKRACAKHKEKIEI